MALLDPLRRLLVPREETGAVRGRADVVVRGDAAVLDDTAALDDTVVRRVGTGQRDREQAQQRLAFLRRVAHPGIAVPESLESRGRTVVSRTPRVPGVDLAEAARRLRGLSAGQAVAVGIAVAEALDALHREGGCHGDVSPANVVVGSEGGAERVALVDVMTGASPTERGTPGFAAPERAVAASAAADVYSLGRVLMSVVGDEGRERLEAWCAPMLRPDASQRPTAAQVARALRSCAEPEPLWPERPPAPGPTVAGELRGRALPPLPRTLKRDHARAWRVWRTAVRASRWALRALAGVAALLLAGTLVSLLWPSPDPVQANYRPTLPVEAHRIAAIPEDAARALTAARVQALADGDAEALLAVTAPGGPARAQDEPVADALRRGAVAYEGLSVGHVSARRLSVVGSTATLEVSYELSPHRVVDGRGAREAPAQSVRAQVEIRWTEELGWRVERALPLP